MWILLLHIVRGWTVYLFTSQPLLPPNDVLLHNHTRLPRFIAFETNPLTLWVVVSSTDCTYRYNIVYYYVLLFIYFK